MRVLTADQEIVRLRTERDEARELIDRQRAEILDLQARASRAEGEATALRETVAVSRAALAALRDERERAELKARIVELESQLSQCLVRATAPSW